MNIETMNVENVDSITFSLLKAKYSLRHQLIATFAQRLIGFNHGAY